MVLSSQLELANHFLLRLLRIGGTFLVLGLGRASGDNIRSYECLKLHQVCPGRSGSRNQFFSQRHITVVVNTGLSNNQRLHLILFAGTPAYTALASQSLMTTAPEPTL